jgi:hypothetical protein
LDWDYYEPPGRMTKQPRREITLTAAELTAMLGQSSSHHSEGSKGCPKRRYALFKMKKFSGGRLTYPIWKQDLLICLDREGFTSEKYKALFLYKNLEGEAEEQVSHLLRPLSDESFAAMIGLHDLLYGEEFDLGWLLVGKLNKLPRLTELNRDNLGKMVITIRAAIPALERREPEALRSTNNDRLVSLLHRLPAMDRTMFLFACPLKNML